MLDVYDTSSLEQVAIDNKIVFQVKPTPHNSTYLIIKLLLVSFLINILSGLILLPTLTLPLLDVVYTPIIITIINVYNIIDINIE